MTPSDPFTTVHKGVRALLFEVATSVARLEPTSDEDVDTLCERIDRALDLALEHERAEHAVVLPVLEIVDRRLAARLRLRADDLRASFGLVRQAARALALAPGSERTASQRAL